MVGLGATMLKISIHAPREGGDFTQEEYDYLKSRFQSTPPARGATSDPVLYGERTAISIHAPREGGDIQIAADSGKPLLFQSTPPARGATPSSRRSWDSTLISIHAPREGGDAGGRGQRPRLLEHFNPRPPRGGRLHAASFAIRRKHFNPRPPRGGRPHAGPSGRKPGSISIHAPREGGDRYVAAL